MQTALLNNELNLTCPEGFREMSKEELSGYNFYSEAPGWCVNDADRHIMVSVSWKQVPGLFARMLKVKDVAKSMEGQMAQAMKTFQYKLVEFTARTPGGKEAEGFRYDYTVQDTGMSGESLCVKNRNTFYYLHFYYRTALKEESMAVVDEILQSASWMR